MKTAVHPHSLIAYYDPAHVEGFNERERLILAALHKMGQATHRQLQQFLEMPELGSVQPRCSDLIRKGTIEECGKVRCEFTGSTVRLLRIRAWQDERQMEIAL
jgi:hypothetical protein